MLCITLLPLVAAASRRLQDTGEDGHFAAIPILMPLVTPMVVIFIFSPISVVPFIGTGIVLLLAGLALIICVAISFIWIGPLIGQLIVPSEPGTNRFGTNPTEVPS